MFSMQNLLCKGAKWYLLLEASAEEAQLSVKNLVQLLNSPGQKRSLLGFVEARRIEKGIAKQLTEQLLSTFLTPFERQDIEALSHALYRIPKNAEKFAERFLIADHHASAVDFSKQILLLERAATLVLLLVRELRTGAPLKSVAPKNDELQRLESQADDLMVASLGELYRSDHAEIRVIVLKDLYELLEKIFDRCRDAGNIVLNVAIKYS